VREISFVANNCSLFDEGIFLFSVGLKKIEKIFFYQEMLVDNKQVQSEFGWTILIIYKY